MQYNGQVLQQRIMTTANDHEAQEQLRQRITTAKDDDAHLQRGPRTKMQNYGVRGALCLPRSTVQDVDDERRIQKSLLHESFELNNI